MTATTTMATTEEQFKVRATTNTRPTTTPLANGAVQMCAIVAHERTTHNVEIENGSVVKVEESHASKSMHPKQLINQIDKEAEHVSIFQLQNQKQIQCRQHLLLAGQQVSHTRHSFSEHQILGHLQRHIQFPSRPPDPPLEQPVHANSGQIPPLEHQSNLLKLLSHKKLGQISLNQLQMAVSGVITVHGNGAIAATNKHSLRWRKQRRCQHRTGPHSRGGCCLRCHDHRASLRHHSRPKRCCPKVSHLIKKIRRAVYIPVMAKSRIGHVVESQNLEFIGINDVTESEVLTNGDKDNNINKHNFFIPFVCGCCNRGQALSCLREGTAMISVKAKARTWNIVEGVCHVMSRMGVVIEVRSLEDEVVAAIIDKINGVHISHVIDFMNSGRGLMKVIINISEFQLFGVVCIYPHGLDVGLYAYSPLLLPLRISTCKDKKGKRASFVSRIFHNSFSGSHSNLEDKVVLKTDGIVMKQYEQNNRSEVEICGDKEPRACRLIKGDGLEFTYVDDVAMHGLEV